MTRRMHGIGLVVAASALAGPAVAAEPDGVQTRLAELEAEVARLRGEGWLNDQRADEVRSLVQDVLADADTRSSLLQSGMSAGYDKGFVIGSTDGNFKLKINGLAQVRFIFNNQNGDSVDANRSGFENYKTKVIFSGHVVDPSWQYKIQGNFGSDGGTFGLQDGFIRKAFDNGTYLRVGQFKSPWLREELVDDPLQLAVDRSLTNQYFTQGRTQGIEWGYDADTWRMSAMFHDGSGAINSPALGYDTEFALTARGEILLAGDWSQFADWTSPRGSEFGASIGIAGFWEEDEYGTPATDEVTRYGVTVDAQLEGDGWNAGAAFIWTNMEDDASLDASPWGFMVQGGVHVSDDVELFARYEFIDTDGTGATDEDVNVITAGVNYYIAGQNLKWTNDIGFALDGIDSTTASPGIGWRADEAGEDGQFVFRSQLQLRF